MLGGGAQWRYGTEAYARIGYFAVKRGFIGEAVIFLESDSNLMFNG
jgi:hypothetical protein